MAKSDYVSEFQGQKDGRLDEYPFLRNWSREEMKPIRNDEVEYYLTKIYSELNKGLYFISFICYPLSTLFFLFN